MKNTFFQVIIVVLIAFVAGVFFASSELISNNKEDAEQHLVEDLVQEFFTCSMHPHIKNNHEGDCPICGMPLVKKQVEPVQLMNSGYPEIYVQAAVINNFGIKTDKVTRGDISNHLRIYGSINKVKKSGLILLKSPVAGKVRFINTANDNKFYKNEVIVSVESDLVLELQKQFINAINLNDIKHVKQLKHQLITLGFNLKQINQLVKTQKASNILMMRYPSTGKMIDLKVRLNQSIKLGQVVGEFLPSYSISAVARVYESQWVWLKAGQKVVMYSRNYPDIKWFGEVRSIGKLGQSSTTAVRFVADFEGNANIKLRLGMQSEMIVYTQAKVDVLKVPTSAVIHTGKKTIVVLSKGNGVFQPVVVKTGLGNKEVTEIIAGLEEGMKVVVSGQFLLDSESELQAEISRMTLPTKGN